MLELRPDALIPIVTEKRGDRRPAMSCNHYRAGRARERASICYSGQT
ncbi:hypothetical protein MPL3365_370017 [Mesorhizobium plurifarium]|uniref:Uncharacterized protein n=1 Tax=Mesorhizobium plurifarium TaxID=69974 RepID=A0A090GVK4_MESPL|nr:hypothetical protein MPL3365_370017 [Mesorhizobium plurifarium]